MLHVGDGSQPGTATHTLPLLSLEQWKEAVLASGVAELIDIVDGLAEDAEAVA